MKWVFDLQEKDVYWCTADVGWVTGHSYVVYGPLAAGATTLMYEGAPDFPQFDRWWSIVEKHRVSIFYTSPTAIRALIRQGEQWPNAQGFVKPAAAGIGGRADQSRSLGVVSPGHRQGPLPHRGYMVADRNRSDHDRADAGRRSHSSRARARCRCPDRLDTVDSRAIRSAMIAKDS